MCSFRRHYSSLSTDPLFVFSHRRDRQFSKIKCFTWDMYEPRGVGLGKDKLAYACALEKKSP